MHSIFSTNNKSFPTTAICKSGNIRKIEAFSPNKTLKQIKDNINPICKMFGLQDKDIEKIDLQWKKINLISWKNTTYALEFWIEVYAFKMQLITTLLKN